MTKLAYLFLLPLFVWSCGEQNEKTENYETVELIEAISPEIEELSQSHNEETAEEDTNVFGSVKITCSDFDFVIFNSSFYEDRTISAKNEDTLNTYLELGEYLDSAIIEIHHGGMHSIEIYQMHENSISISNEGPHCDLIDWKHYHSDWIKIKKLNNYDFIAETYTNEDWKQFIDVDIKELQEAVLIHCGEKWTEYVSDLKKHNEYPSGVSMNKIFFKIVLTDLETAEITQQIISFDIPMGC